MSRDRWNSRKSELGTGFLSSDMPVGTLGCCEEKAVSGAVLRRTNDNVRTEYETMCEAYSVCNEVDVYTCTKI